MMKNTVFFLVLILFAGGMSAAEKPVLHYDFTQSDMVPGGLFKRPVFQQEVEIAEPEAALILHKNNFAKIPESECLSLYAGGTLYCTVKFLDTAPKSLDMIFFKDGDFLLGRDGNKLYFNAADGKIRGGHWNMAVQYPGISAGRWLALTAVIASLDRNHYNVSLFINGKKVASRKFERTINPPSSAPVTLGKGWGGPWFMNGMLGKVMIFSSPLSDAEVASLSAQDPYIQKDNNKELNPK